MTGCGWATISFPSAFDSSRKVSYSLGSHSALAFSCDLNRIGKDNCFGRSFSHFKLGHACKAFQTRIQGYGLAESYGSKWSLKFVVHGKAFLNLRNEAK